MKARVIVKIGIVSVLFCLLGVMSVADPVVSNVRAQQRPGTGFVDIYYDVTGTAGQASVSVAVSDDSGATYDVAVSSLSGDVGFGISFGSDRHIVWDALADAPGIRSETMRVELTVTPFIEAVPMVDVPAGSFAMGDNLDGMSDAPVHSVTLSAYKMGQTEVTWAQWQGVRDWAVANSYTDLDGIGAGKGDDHPVYNVAWYDVVKWCNAASEKIGLEPVYYLSDGGAVYRTGQVSPFIDYTKNGYRLPTEAEWERAARGGLEGKRFPWGDTISHAEANYFSNPKWNSYDTNSYEGSHPEYDDGSNPLTSPVGSFSPNGYGLYDAAGNLWEWCGDWRGSNYYESSPATNPVGPDSGLNRVLRGGAWFDQGSSSRVAERYAFGSTYRTNTFGFRLSRNKTPLASFHGEQSISESNIFPFNTVTFSVGAGALMNGSVTGMGTYLDGTTATLTAVPDAGYIFVSWESSLLNTLVDVPLATDSAVSVWDYGAERGLALNGIGAYVPTRRYLLETGTYRLSGIPVSAPLAIVTAGQESAINYTVDNAAPIEIYVSGGSTTAPFYQFEDAEGTDLTAAFSSGYALMRNRTYRFIANGISASHPFMVNSSRFATQESWVSGSPMTGSGGVLEVTLPENYVQGVQFYCTVHQNMNGYFNLSLVNVDGQSYDEYWGDVNVTVFGDFGTADVVSSNDSIRDGTDLLVYNDGTLLTAATNPITILVDGDKTVTATFEGDPSDADSDGLSAYEEHVIYGTDPSLFDTDGDTHSDQLEAVTFGSNPLDASSVPEYTLMVNTFNGSVTGAGAIEINTTATLTAIPEYGYAFLGWTGAASGTDNPISIHMDADKSVGADFVSQVNYDRLEQAGYEAGETAGISQGVLQGISQGKAAVLADPASYNLYNAGIIQNGLRLGGMRISDATGSKLISFNIESSEDLQTWTLEERIERSLALPSSGSLFIRVSVPVEDVVPMVSIPAGTFEMGDAFSEGYSYELPVHTVTLSAYKMGETEVTWVQWQEVRDWAVSNGYTDLDGIGAGKGDDHPVHSVNWYDVVKWCNAASEKLGLEPVYYLSDGGAVYRTGQVNPFIDYTKNGYRLPTEAEWEKAARGGLKGKRFPWGDTISHAEANYYATPNNYSYDVSAIEGYHPDYDGGAPPFTSPVRSFAANGLGLYDMVGNVYEWCGDWHGSSYYGISPATDPIGPDSGLYRVVRGGFWINTLNIDWRVSHRDRFAPVGRGDGVGPPAVGFRVSRNQ